MVASNEAQVGPRTDVRVERYRRAERAFWDSYGLAPAERFVEVGWPRCSASCTASAAWSLTGPAGG